MGKRLYGNYRLQDAVLPPIRMYSEELESIRQAAKSANQSVAQWVRERLLPEKAPESEIPAEPIITEIRSVIRPLEAEVRHAFPKPTSSAKKHVKR